MGAKWGILCLCSGLVACQSPQGLTDPRSAVGDGRGESEFRPIPQEAVKGNPPAIAAASAILVDAATGEVLYEKSADTRRSVASTQKLLTALLVVEKGRLNQPVSLRGQDLLVNGTTAGLQIGETYTRGELLEALLLKSANDAALALARDQSGSVVEFTRQMNARARNIGATHSRFANPHGLDAAKQYSTARDLAKIARAAYRHPELFRIFSKEFAHLTTGRHHLKPLWNTNELVYRSPRYTGMKSGYTLEANKCLIASIYFDGREAILVQLGGAQNTIFNDAETLFSWALRSPIVGPSSGFPSSMFAGSGF